MNKEVIGKYLMGALGLGLTVAANIVSSRNQEVKMKETIAKEVAEYCKNQTKES
jgi:hypothetical protein